MAGIGLAQVMGNTNVIALVGGGRRPKFAANKVKFSPQLKHGWYWKLTLDALGRPLGRSQTKGGHRDHNSDPRSCRSNLPRTRRRRPTERRPNI